MTGSLRNVRVAVVLAVATLPAALCRGELAEWDRPAIDSWVYTNAFVGAGFRELAPTFGGVFLDGGASPPALAKGDTQSPARLGSFLVAFETTDQVPAGLAPHRYAVRSATVTARVEGAPGGAPPYTDQPASPAGVLAQALSGGVSAEQPLELFGVGFRSGYAGFALGVDPTGLRFAESTTPYSASTGYRVYPATADGAGGLVDVSNNLTGGFSATASGSHTEPFAATPWGVGDAGLAAGASISGPTTVTFAIDLAAPGVLRYVQESLSDGALGFFLSSVHPAAQFGGAGGGAYPQWFTKEAVGVFAGAEAPTLSLDFAVLPIPGDYNADGLVSAADRDAWRDAYGSAVVIPGTGADGNADGLVDAADYTVWRDAPAAPRGVAVPEPSAAVYALAGVTLVTFLTGVCASPSPRRPEE